MVNDTLNVSLNNINLLLTIADYCFWKYLCKQKKINSQVNELSFCNLHCLNEVWPELNKKAGKLDNHSPLVFISVGKRTYPDQNCIAVLQNCIVVALFNSSVGLMKIPLCLI